MNYTWNVTNLYTVDADGFTGYVVNALYEVTGVDGEYTANCQGSAQFKVGEGTEFIPYADLTNDIVIGWVQSELGEDGIGNLEANIVGQINSQKNPPVSPSNTPLPWN